jgi:hypothetical protein
LGPYPSADEKPSAFSKPQDTFLFKGNRYMQKVKKRRVASFFWDDEYIAALTPNAKLIFLHLLTNPLTLISGVYQLTDRRIAFDTGVPPDETAQILEELERDDKIKRREGFIAIKNWIDHQEMNPSIQKAIGRQLAEVPPELIEFVDGQEYLQAVAPTNYNRMRPSKRTSTYDPSFDYEGIAKKWNDFAAQYGLEKVGGLTELRRFKIKEKFSLKTFDFDKILTLIPDQEFLLGAGRDKWKVDFDFIFLTDDGYIKIMERKYIGKPSTSNGNKKPKGRQGERASFEHTADDYDRYADLTDSLRERERQWSERTGPDPE